MNRYKTDANTDASFDVRFSKGLEGGSFSIERQCRTPGHSVSLIIPCSFDGLFNILAISV